MKAVFSCLFLLCCIIVRIRGQDEAALEKKYKNFDFNKILESKRLVNNYVNCLIDAGPCTNEGLDLKKALPEALKDQCRKCSESTLQKAITVMKKVKYGYPDEWNILLKKWDPSGENWKKFVVTNGKKYGIE